MYQLSPKIITWLPEETIEPEAKQQLINISEMPFIFKHLAVMPDCHLGMGATVGSVIATKGAIIPAAVGVDIGCGMIAVKTKFTDINLPANLKKVREGIERRIPLGAGAWNNNITDSAALRIVTLKKRPSDPSYFSRKWEYSLGTLGSGNHFVELCLDQNKQLWVVLHSGSRGIGNQIAQYHIKIAKKLMENFHIKLTDQDLAYLPEESNEFKDYIRDLLWAQDFALANREEMMDRVMKELSYTFYNEDGHQKEIELERVNCHHNFTQLENHFGHNVWITRKGAIQMKLGQLGIVPGSMGTNSYIVSGLENPLSYHSAPHGAGRKFSRTKARSLFTMEDFEKEMQGIECRHSKELIDELPGAYKDIHDVMENSKELVKIEFELKQILNVKGD